MLAPAGLYFLILPLREDHVTEERGNQEVGFCEIRHKSEASRAACAEQWGEGQQRWLLVWRSPEVRAASARERLSLAAEMWRWQPHPRQREFFCAEAQARVAACGRRWGKTEALAVDIATLALAEVRAGRACRQLIVAPTDAQARLIGGEVLGLLWAALKGGDAEVERLLHGLKLDTHRTPCLQIVVHPAGVDPKVTRDGKPGDPHPAPVARLLFRPAGVDGRGLRGLWAHRIVVDEAGYVPDTVITDVLLPMLTDAGGELTLASSPAGRRHVFYRLWARGEASPGAGLTVASFQCPSRDNPHLDKAFLAAMREELGEHTYAAEYEAQFVDEGGAVFREEDIEAALGGRPARCLGRWQSGQPAAAGPAVQRRRGLGAQAGLHGGVRAGRHGAARTAGGPLALAGRKLGPAGGADGGSGGGLRTDEDSRRRQLHRRHSGGELAAGRPRPCAWTGRRVPPVEMFLFGAESKTRLVDRLTLGLSGRALTYPHHAVLLAELRGFEYGPVGASGRARMAARGSGHDDIVMALALAWYAAPPGAPPPPGSLLMLGSQAGLRRREAASP